MPDNDSKIVVDLNRVNRRTLRQFRQSLKEIPEDDFDRREEVTGEFYQKVIVSWPFEVEISADAYLNLGMLDQFAVDEAINEAFNAFSEKK